MKCVVINGTDVRGCTYFLKEIFLDQLKPRELKEFYLPKDAPDFCIGCKKCFFQHESKCPHHDRVGPIWNAMMEADLIVFAYPVYVFRTPGHVKTLLDHLGAHFQVHRPKPEMYSKTAVIITQSVGAPNWSAQRDVEASLRWFGVAKVKKIGFTLKEGTYLSELSDDRKNKLESKLRAFADKLKDTKPRGKSLRARMIFAIAKKMHQSKLKTLKKGDKLSVDLEYWIEKGWISDDR